MRNITSCLLILTCLGQAFGQTFRGESKIARVERDGFYNIAITPAMSPYLNSTYTNIRLFDDHGTEVPYIVESEEPIHHTKEFREYTIVEKLQKKNCCTTLMLENPRGESINNISLSIKNAETTKEASLVGSDDKENWYVIKEHFTISSILNDRQTYEIRILDFPLSNYSFYKIEINDSTSAPLNILGAGYYEVLSEEGKFTPVPVKVRESVSAKKTFITLSFDSVRTIDKVTLSMKGSPYFLRQGTIYQRKELETRKGDKTSELDYLSTFVISSKQTSTIELEGEMTNELVIVVDNADNPSLQISALQAYQLNRYMTAWLKKDQSYTIKFGDKALPAASYDIGYFKDSIPTNLEMVKAGQINSLTDRIDVSPTVFTNRIIIWIAIGAVIVVLGFMAIRMAKEAGEKN